MDGPKVFIEGVDVIIERDLDKHREQLDLARIAKQAAKEASAYIVERKRHYVRLTKDPTSKYDPKAMDKAIENMNVDIRQAEDQAQIAQKSIEHHELIVRTLEGQLREYNKSMRELSQIRKDEIDAASN